MCGKTLYLPIYNAYHDENVHIYERFINLPTMVTL